MDGSPLSVITSLTQIPDKMELTQEQKNELAQRNEQRMFMGNVAKIAFRHASDARRRYDYEWMVRDLFRRGYQFSRYQPTTQTILLASRQSAKIPINIVNAQMRSIASQVTSFRPKWEVMPRYANKESETNARYSGKLLDYYFDRLGLKKMIKETVIEGLMYSVGGPWEVVYNAEEKEIEVWKRDPWDFYFDPLATTPNAAEFQIIAARRPLGEVIYNEEYDALARSEIRGGEGKLAASEYKQFMLQAIKYVTQFNKAESPEIILYDGKFRIHEEGKKAYLRHVVWTEQNSVPLLYEDLDTNEYDTELYQADLNPNEVYGESWMKHVMPLNRVLNSLESSVFDYNYRFAKGRIVVDKDAGVRAIHNQHGEIISKKRGSEVRALDISPLPIATSAQIERIYKYMEDISGVHDPSLGRVPPGSRSGVMLAEMKQSDSTNQDVLVDNLEDFLTNIAKKVLKKISENYTTPKVIQDLGYKEEDAKYFAVVGKNFKSQKKDGDKKGFKIGPDYVDLAVIGSDNNIRVTIGSWLGYTKEMMQEKTIKLLQLGAINQATFLRLWEFGNVDSIVQQTRIEQMLQARLQQKPGGMQQVDPQVENDMMVLELKPVMPDPHDDHYIHIAFHQEALGQGADELVQRHIDAHYTYLSQQEGAGATDMLQQEMQQEQGQPQQPQQTEQGAGAPQPAGAMGQPPQVSQQPPVATSDNMQQEPTAP